MSVPEDELTRRVKEFAQNQGADLIGIAAEERFAPAPPGHKPADILPGAKNVICCAIHLSDTIFDGLPGRMVEYTGHLWAITGMLNVLGTRITLFLEKMGYRSIPIPAGGVYLKDSFRGTLSHKHAAQEAGLGEIGYNNLLLTPEYGPRVRLVSIVTDAPLKSDPKPRLNLCAERRNPKSANFCDHACSRNTPPECLVPSEDDENLAKVNRTVCRYWGEHVIGKDYVSYAFPMFVCGLCISHCPIGFLQNREKTAR